MERWLMEQAQVAASQAYVGVIALYVCGLAERLTRLLTERAKEEPPITGREIILGVAYFTSIGWLVDGTGLVFRGLTMAASFLLTHNAEEQPSVRRRSR